jgi:hypothetical protein
MGVSVPGDWGEPLNELEWVRSRTNKQPPEVPGGWLFQLAQNQSVKH